MNGSPKKLHRPQLSANDENHVEPFLDYLNSKHDCFKFTSEKEENGTLPFRDLKIERKNSTLSTSIYRKPTFTGLLSRFDSFTPDKYKDNLFATLVHRGFKLCSSFLSFDIKVNFLKSLLKQNGYPLSLIEKNY